MGFFQSVQRVVREADVILLVVDARMPEMSKNEEMEKIVARARKKMFIVFNKIDLIKSENVTKLRKTYPEALFVSSAKNLGFANLKSKLLILCKREGYNKIRVGVVGYPNVGKSSVINCLAHRARTLISSVAGTTKGSQFVRIGDKIKLIDSPGVIPMKDRETKLAIIAAKNPEKLSNPEYVAYQIIKLILNEDKKVLEDYYGIKIEDLDEGTILLDIGKKKGFLKKGAIVDEIKTSISLIRDWQKGKLRL